jgi:hypothetical protein
MSLEWTEWAYGYGAVVLEAGSGKHGVLGTLIVTVPKGEC